MGLKIRCIVFFVCLFVLGCERYSAFKDAELIATFSKEEIGVGEDFTISFRIISSKNGVVELPVNRLCSIRFFLRNGSGKESERFCSNEDLEKIELSPGKNFAFDMQGRLIKSDDGLTLKFSDDVYVTLAGSVKLNLMLEYIPGFFESESNIHLARPISIMLQDEMVLVDRN